MSNEHRVIESNILSGNRIGNHNIIVVAIIPVFAVTIIAAIAIWPFLTEIGLAMLWLLAVLGICIALVITALTVFAVHALRLEYHRRKIQSRVITWEAGAAWIDDGGTLVDLSATHEAAKLPASRVIEVTEQKGDEEMPVDRLKQAMDILEIHSHGTGIKTIAKTYQEAGDKFWTEWRVRQLVSGREK